MDDMTRIPVGIINTATIIRTKRIDVSDFRPPSLLAILAIRGSMATAKIIPHTTGIINGFINLKANMTMIPRMDILMAASMAFFVKIL